MMLYLDTIWKVTESSCTDSGWLGEGELGIVSLGLWSGSMDTVETALAVQSKFKGLSASECTTLLIHSSEICLWKKTMLPGLCDSITAEKSTKGVWGYACLVVTKESQWGLWLREVLCGLKKGWWRFGNVKHTQTPCFWSWLDNLLWGWVQASYQVCTSVSSAIGAQLAAQLHSRICQRVTRAVPSGFEHWLSTYTDTSESLIRSITDRTILLRK